MRTLIYITTLLLMIVGARNGQCQQPWDDTDHQLSLEIPEISLVAIAPTNEVIKLYLYLPGAEGVYEAGSESNSATWINYSNALKKKSSSKKLTARISSGQLPAGLELKLLAEDCTTGKGNVGKKVGQISLSNKQQTLISDIGGSSTGKGKNFGHQLKYELVLKDINILEFEETNTLLTVTYTISD